MLGLICRKLGMSQQFNEDGDLVPVTILKVEDNLVINKKNIAKDGYSAVVVGASDMKEKSATKPYRGQFKDGLSLKRCLKEFIVDDADKYEIGQPVGFEVLEGTDYVDVIGTSKGKGFQGVVKRHGFGGGRKTHGSKFHRQNGSTGQSAFPSRVQKGIKRAGRMGCDRVTVQNLKVIEKNIDDNILVLKGAVPGNNKGIVYIKKAVKK